MEVLYGVRGAFYSSLVFVIMEFDKAHNAFMLVSSAMASLGKLPPHDVYFEPLLHSVVACSGSLFDVIYLLLSSVETLFGTRVFVFFVVVTSHISSEGPTPSLCVWGHMCPYACPSLCCRLWRLSSALYLETTSLMLSSIEHYLIISMLSTLVTMCHSQSMMVEVEVGNAYTMSILNYTFGLFAFFKCAWYVQIFTFLCIFLTPSLIIILCC